MIKGTMGKEPAEVRQGLFAFCPCCLREVGQRHKVTCPDATVAHDGR